MGTEEVESWDELITYRGRINRVREITLKWIDALPAPDEYSGSILSSLYNFSISNSIIGDILLHQGIKKNVVAEEGEIEQSSVVVDKDLKEPEGSLSSRLAVIHQYTLNLINEFLSLVVNKNYAASIPSRYLATIEANLQEAKYNIEYELNTMNNAKL